MAPCEGVDSSTSAMETFATREFSSEHQTRHSLSMPQSRDARQFENHESFVPKDNPNTQQQQHTWQNSKKRPLYGEQESHERFHSPNGQSNIIKQPRQEDFTRDTSRGNDFLQYKEEHSNEQKRDTPLVQHQKHQTTFMDQSIKERALEPQSPFVKTHQPPRHMQGSTPQPSSRWNHGPRLQNEDNGLQQQQQQEGNGRNKRENHYAQGSSRMMRPPWSGERRSSGQGAPNRGPRGKEHCRYSGGRRSSNWNSSFPSRGVAHIPRRQSVSKSTLSDSSFCSGESVQKGVLKFQPGLGAATHPGELHFENGRVQNGSVSHKKLQTNLSISLPSSRNGHLDKSSLQPPPPPLGSLVANQKGSLSPASCGPAQHKRVRSTSPLPRRESSSLGERWEPSNRNDDVVSKRDLFAGRFVPKGGTAPGLDTLWALKEQRDSSEMALLVNSTDHTRGTPKANGCSDSATDKHSPKESNVSAALKLPDVAHVGDAALKEVVTDVKTAKVAEITIETADLKTSASNSSFTLPRHANMAHHSAEITESPYSLMVPEDDNGACEEKNPANTTNHNDVLVLQESSQRATNGNVDTIKNDFEHEKPWEILVPESVQPDACLANVTKEDSGAVSVQTENALATAPLQVPPHSDIMQFDSSDSDSSDDETDEEELQAWAKMMFNIPPPIMVPVPAITTEAFHYSSDEESDDETESRHEHSSPRLRLHLKMPSVKESKKPRRRKKAVFSTRKKGKGNAMVKFAGRKKDDEELLDSEEAKRKKEEAKPLTAAEVRKILAEDDMGCAATSLHWVRRSMRQPSRSVLHNPGVKSLVEKLRVNDYDMVVLKMKKYISDSSTPCSVIDVALDALEENTNCQALYIQNFNEGMRDKQVQHLLRILQMPANKIWCLNIGETYNVKTKTWKLFAEGLKTTKVTHMYASEHTISNELKEKIRDTIRQNRKKHDLHCNPANLDVIMQCTHCWWNPFNAKALRPFIRQQERYEKILADAEAQGLPGSNSLPAGGMKSDYKGKIE